MNSEHGRKTAYANYGEDQILMFLFENVSDGFFVDAGCFHPTLFSNTKTLYDKGWRGVNIDANPFMIEVCKRIRPEDTNLHLALSSQKGTTTYFKFSDWGSSNTIDVNFKNKITQSQGVEVTEKIEVSTLTLKDIFEQYKPTEKDILFLNVDVENFDLIVIQSNDWNVYRPLIVAIEDFQFKFETPNESEIYNYMRGIGYTMFSRTIYTSFFCDTGRMKETPIWWGD
jgi:FkbM family methyltransferase